MPTGLGSCRKDFCGALANDDAKGHRVTGSDDDVPAIRVRRQLALIVADAFGKIVAIGVGHADRRT
jgi:hypothetical protein